MSNVIIGTAGHIDHGKTTLIKALTGKNTDKLKEEIKRGISINLGFAYFDLPSGKRAGIIDVPGHESFIRNMLAGSAGIDIVMLTVAANEGVKPQTIEHLDILSFLNIKKGIIVVTKIDMADEIMLELAIDDIKEKVEGTFFENAEIVLVDSVSGKGIKELAEKLDVLANSIVRKNENASPRLPIDRIFTMKGFGTIVTGTLIDGRISVDDELVLYPKNIKAKIRNIQVYEENVNTAYAGQRTAVNISNLKPSDIDRGDVLARADALVDTVYLDVKLTLVSHTEKVLKHWDRVRVYLGAKEILARVVPLDKSTIAKGESAFCQLRLEKAFAAKKNDKFVIRTFSPLETIGGGIILDPNPQRHGSSNETVISNLAVKESGDIVEIIEEYILGEGEKLAGAKDIANYAGISENELTDLLKELSQTNTILKINDKFMHINVYENYKVNTLETLSKYHEANGLKQGCPKEELRSKQSFNAKDFEVLLKMLEKEGVIKLNALNNVAAYTFKVTYSDKQEKIKQEIEQKLLEGGFAPPDIAQLTNGKKEYQEVLDSLINNTVMKLDNTTVIHKEFYDKAKEIVKNLITENQGMSLADFRDYISGSRKYALLILEEFDKIKFTKRLDNKRVLYYSIST